MDTLKIAVTTRFEEIKKARIAGSNKGNTENAGKKERPRNYIWEAAENFGEYVNLPTPFVMKLFRIYGQAKVLDLRSWLKDCPHDPKRYAGLVIWKLKQK